MTDEKEDGVAKIHWRILLTVVLAIAAALSVEYLGLYGGIDRYVYDLFFRLRGSRTPSRQIVVVAADEKTLGKLGRWPIERKYYVRLLERLALADVVGLDIIFTEASAEDVRLSEPLRGGGRVILPVYIDRQVGIVYPGGSLSRFPTGHIHIEPGIDGVVREVFHTLYYDGIRLPSFAAAVFNALPDHAFHPAAYPPGKERPAADRDIVQMDPMCINFYGGGEAFQKLSFSDVLDGRWAPAFFSGKTVLVGQTAAGIGEGFLTPFSGSRNLLAGVDLHANILANLLDENPIRPVGRLMTSLFGFLLSAGGFLVFLRLGVARTTLLWLLGLLSFLSAAFLLFSASRVWVAPGAVSAALTVAFLTAYIVKLMQMRRQIEDARMDWEKAFDTIEDGIVIYDRDCRMLQCNRAAKQYLATPLLHILNQRCAKLIHDVSADDGNGASAAAGKERGVIEEIHDTSTDRHFEIRSLAYAEPSSRSGSCPDRVIQVTRDITYRIMNEKKQQQLQTRLAHSQKMEAIGTLAGGIAHDFNNILAAIVGYTQLAAAGIPQNSGAQAKLEQVLKAGRRARDLVYQILTFSRGHRESRQTFQMGLIVKEAVKLLRSTIPATIKIKQNITTTGVVAADPTQIHQIVVNLCTNAYHAMRGTGGTLGVFLEEVDMASPGGGEVSAPPPSRYLKLTVSDTGHGIPEDIQKRIFEPYFTTKRHGDGTGLGLATVHGIVKNYGGWIEVESDAGKGSIFHVYFPQITRADMTEPQEKDKSPEAGSGRILFVDDEPGLTILYHELLEGLGFAVDAQDHPVTALEMFRMKPDRFDLVITDMTMPEMTGLELVREIRKIRPEIGVILCTGYSEEITREKLREAGIRELMMKPVAIADLVDTMRRILAEDAGTKK